MFNALPAQWTDAMDRPDGPAFWTEQVIGPDGAGEVLGMLRHAHHAFVAQVPGDVPTEVADAEYQRVAFEYLSALPTGLQPRADVLGQLSPARASSPRVAPEDQNDFGWLRVGWAVPGMANEDRDPRGSYWVRRQVVPGPVLDNSLVLMAAPRHGGRAMGGDVGLRLTMHVDAPTDIPSIKVSDIGGRPIASNWPHCRVRIFGVTYSRLDAEASRITLQPVVGHPNRPVNAADKAMSALMAELRTRLNFSAGISFESAQCLPAAGGAPQVRLSGLGWRKGQDLGKGSARQVRGYRFLVDVRSAADAWQVLATSVPAEIYSAAMAANINPHRQAQVHGVFDRDPASCGPAAAMASRRPTRDAQALGAYGIEIASNRLQTDGAGSLVLGQAGRFSVVSLGQRRQTARSTLQTVGRGDPTVSFDAQTALPLRSDRLAAVQAYIRAAELFYRLSAYGLQPTDYFRQAKLPLMLQLGLASRGGPGAEAVNAEVTPYKDDTSAAHGPTAQAMLGGPPPQLLVSFGAADSSHRESLRTLDKRHRAQYLGIAADPRWAWHEFGHVLNYASTGELEFAFAHSAGDALAAIACDPDSVLAWDEEMRFLTFPWVQTTRRHDRSASVGYCWCGARNALRLARGDALDEHRHGYFQEQLLSSSLFRLYQCLGGDTRDAALAATYTSASAASVEVQDADLPLRRAASDYCVYLIMRGIALMGPDSIAPARSPDQFVSALIDADLGTSEWSVIANWPLRSPRFRKLRRQGGRVHKVIRWAFEQQGLYATDRPMLTKEGTGLAPPVDVFVADRRSPAADGGYHPVPLRWHGASGVASAWMAADDVVSRTQAGDLVVRVGNRGWLPAVGVSARVWWCRADDASTAWPWQPFGDASMTGSTAIAGAKNGAPSFADLPIRAPSGAAIVAHQAIWLFVNAHSGVDPSNWPLNAPPPSDAEDLMELVAHDNNLALCAWPGG